MDISRRSFVKTTAIALASAAAAGALSGCAAKVNEPINNGSVKTTQAVCRFCGCGCGLLVETRNGKILSIKGDPQNDSNRGLNCVKGYYLAKALNGKDRLTKPMIRADKSTKGTGAGKGLKEATWDEALDLVAKKLKETWKNDKSRLAFWGSGQQPIVEGYAQAKLWKAGLLSNNIDPNARLCMASAVVAFMNVFQTDEPAGCYADIDDADLFITWGANMAEAHPMLYSRVMTRLQEEGVRHFDVTTLRTRTSANADKVIIFKPNGDLAILNCIAHYLVENKKYDEAFVKDHLQFKQGTENIGNATYDAYDKTEGATADKVESITFEEYAKRLEPYTWEYASKLSGVSVEDLQALYEAFADPKLKIMSLWTMGVNQHNRGTWVNHCIYNIHLLTGKIAKPGNGPFSLTGQPSACGTAREVGTFCHRLPADLVVNNEAHRRYSEAVWNLPEGYLEPISSPGYHTIKMFRELSNGGLDFFWSAHNNWAVSAPNLTRYLGRGAEDKKGIFDTFIVVSEVYPTLSTQYADVVLPAAMWIEREGMFGNGERRTAVFEQAATPPGDAKWDLWMLMEIAWRVLEGEKIGNDDAFDLLFGEWYDKEKRDFRFETQREVCRAIFEEYRTFSNPDLNPRAAAINAEKKLKMEAKQLAPYDEYIYNHGLTWPVRNVNGKWLPTKWRFSNGKQEDGFDQYGVAKYGDEGKANDISFYKSADKKPSVVFRPWEPPAELPNDEYPFVFNTGRFLEHWHTGSMTRQVEELNRAMPEALLDMNPADAQRMGINDGDMVKLTSRWGEVEIKASLAGRTVPPEGYLFAPFFAEETLINLVVQETYCPLSKEPDFKKTCVRVEKISK